MGLYAQQHRGQEACGIVCGHRGQLTVHKGMGLVSDVFTPEHLRSTYGGRLSLLADVGEAVRRAQSGQPT